MIWWSLLIPVLAFILFGLAAKNKTTILRLLLVVAISFITVIASYFIEKEISLSDTEYKGFYFVRARYYEAWETYVHKTCTRTVHTGKTTISVPYDCSYCDENSAEFVAWDNNGNAYSISEEFYYHLKWKWQASPKFIELNRDINTSWGCGKDGDAYDIEYDGTVARMQCATQVHTFTNYLQTNHSAFNFPEVDGKKLGLFEYPVINEDYYQPSVLGYKNYSFNQCIDAFNGEYGMKKKVRVYVLVFKNKDIKTAFNQEAYWTGGNQNEIVICVGLNGEKVSWIKPFSWCDNKELLVNLREDLKKCSLDGVKWRKVLIDNMRFYRYKKFEDFNYLTFEPTTSQIIFVYILVTLISLISSFAILKHDKLIKK